MRPDNERAAAMAALRDQGLTYSAIGREFGVSKPTAHDMVARWRRDQENTEGGVSVERSGDDLILDSRGGTRIRTLDDLLAACAVDLTRWTVERWVANKWEVGAKGPDGEVVVEPLFQVKAWLKPLQAVIDAAAVIADLAADMASHAPRYAKPKHRQPAERHMLEVCLMDHHIGQLAWDEEAGADYDSEIAERLAVAAVEGLLSRAAGWPVDRVLLPLGNDFMHADGTMDGAGGATAKGTQLDVDTRWQRSFRHAREVAVTIVDLLRQVAPVDVVVVPGNHDATRMFYLGDALSAWYRQDGAVSIRNDAAPRKYVLYGVTLIGLAHGERERPADLPLIMATEAPAEWAASLYREWHTAHYHAKRDRLMTLPELDEDHGVRLRVLPSLVARDAWAAGRGYSHQRAAEAYVWSHDDGYMGTVSVPARALG